MHATFEDLISCSLAALEWSDQDRANISNDFNERFRPSKCQQASSPCNITSINDFLADYRPDPLSILLCMSQLSFPEFESQSEPLNGTQRCFHTSLVDASTKSLGSEIVSESKQDRRKRQNRESQQRRRQKIIRVDGQRMCARSRVEIAHRAWLILS